MKSKASARWNGGLKDGNGVVSAGSGAFTDLPYTFATRFEGQKGSNPEELIASAHAACFSMALSAQIAEQGMTPQSISTTATVTLDKDASGFQVSESNLDVVAKIPGGDAAKFEKAAANAKEGCPISKLLNTKITLQTRLEN